MTLAAIRARHVPDHVCFGSRGSIWYGGTLGPCDTAIVLAALDEVINEDVGNARDVVAAIKREARLRAALEEAMLHVAGAKRRASIRAMTEATDAD